MAVRKASARDWPAIRRLVKANADTLLQDHLPLPHEFFVAVEDGRVAGCCALVVYSKRLAEIRTLAVDAAHRGKGLATELIEACLAKARAKKVYEVLSITGARGLFEKHGFGTLEKEKYALLKILGR